MPVRLPSMPGVVDEDVQPAVAVKGCPHGGIPVVGAGYVEVDIGGVAAELGYLRFDLLAFVVEQVADDDLRAFAGEEQCLCPRPVRARRR